MSPSNTSNSRTRWPLPTPPIDGLQDICPTSSARKLSKPTRAPRRAAAAAASHPAWPAPITRTSCMDRPLSGSAFHVKLFAQAEATEERIQYVFDTSTPGHPVKSGSCDPQMLGDDYEIICSRCGDE